MRGNVLGYDAEQEALLLLLLKLESEGGLDTSPLVQEASPHVDVGDVSEEPADNVDAGVEDDVCAELLPVVGAGPVLLRPVLVLLVDDVVGGGGGADRQHGDAHLQLALVSSK